MLYNYMFQNKHLYGIVRLKEEMPLKEVGA